MAYNPTHYSHPSASYQPALPLFPAAPGFPTPGFVPPPVGYSPAPPVRYEPQLAHNAYASQSQHHNAGGPVKFYWPPMVKKAKDLLNSTVTDASGHKVLTVSTVKKNTTFSDRDGRLLAKVVWHEWSDPGIEMEGIGKAKEVEIKKWMVSLANKRHRRFTSNGVEYDWADGPAKDNYVRMGSTVSMACG